MTEHAGVHRKEMRLDPSLAQWGIQAITRLLAVYAMVQGAGIIAGGRSRWLSKALALALAVPGAPASWGWALLLLGLTAMVGTLLGFTLRRARILLLACWGIGAWSCFFAIALLPSIVAHGSKVATTGSPTYVFVGVSACLLGVIYRRSA